MRVLSATCLLIALSLPMITQSARRLHNNWNPKVIEREIRSLGLETSIEDLEIEEVALAKALGRRLNNRINGAGNDDGRFHHITGEAVGSWEDNMFDKKCISDHLPDIENAELQCRESWCQGTCLSGYQFPGGLSRFTLICNEETGELEYLDQPFRDTLPPCEPICGSGCQNDGICAEPGRCICQLGFEGDLCEIQISCPHIGIQILNGAVSKVGINLAVTCDSGYQLKTGDDELHFQCEDQAWPMADIFPLVDPATGVIICGPHCEPECQNGGVCTGPGRCTCRRGFWGPRCEVARCTMPKQVIPHTSMGGTLTRMNIKCHDGYKMHGNVTDMQVQCIKGKWMMPDHKTPFTHQMAHCEPICLSGCQNGGTCIGPDECLCPSGFAGKTCQRR